MSSNMANLKKGKKMPLPPSGIGLKHGHRPVPFRDPGYSGDEAKLLDDISTRMATQKLRGLHKETPASLPRLKDASPRVPNMNTAPSTAPNDHDLMTGMMSRLAQLEQRLTFQAKEIIEKDKKMKILQDKVKILNKTREDGDPGQVMELEKKCLLLQQQVHEMETFLADYGMAWIGEKSDPNSHKYNDDEALVSVRSTESQQSDEYADLWRPETSLANPSFEMDYDLVKKNVMDLNALAGDGIAKIQHTIDGARLKMQDAIPLTLYANGLVLFSGPFRPFSDPSTQQCVQDILDGYFPNELQIRYPEGVPIQVTDKRNVYFKDKRHDVFKGTGQMLGGETKPSRLVPSNLIAPNHVVPTTDRGVDTSFSDSPNPSDVQHAYDKEESELPGHKLTMEQFLQRLPASVVKGGKLIDIRGSVGGQLQGQTNAPAGVTIVETPAVQEIKDRLEVSEMDRPPSSRDVTTLRIKTEKGDHTYIVKMKFTDTIGDLRHHLNKQRGKGDYDIMSSFPIQVFANDKATLQDCGLVPNAALHIRPKRSN